MAALIRGHRAKIALLGFLSALGGFCEAAFLVLATHGALALADDGGFVSPLASLSLSMGETVATCAGLVILRLALALAGVAVSTRTSTTIIAGLRHQLSRSFLQSSWPVQQAEPAGRLQQLLVTHTNEMTHAVIAVANAVIACLNLVTLLAIAVVVDPPASTLVLGALLVLGVVLRPLRRAVQRRAARAMERELSFAHDVSDLSKVSLEIQTHGVRPKVVEHLDTLISRNADVLRRVEVLKQSNTPLYVSLAYAAVIAGMGLVSFVDVGDMASMGAVMLLMLRSLTYGQQFQFCTTIIAERLPIAEGLADAIARYEAEASETTTGLPAEAGPMEATGLRFSYGDGPEVLRGLDFRIEQGEVVGIIGPSGTGKSTLLQLLLGVRQPTAGSIRLSGTPIQEIDAYAWTDLVGFVPQEAQVIAGSVADNVRFFRDMDDPTVERSLAAAHLMTEVQDMDNGIDTLIGSRGSQVSGGQRQRLSIARALAGSPSILILDEPTAALDSGAELGIRDTLAGLGDGVTVIVVAHRLSTLRECDRIMVIEYGLLTGFDSAEALATTNAFYRSAVAANDLS